jgi:hypothetical protein
MQNRTTFRLRLLSHDAPSFTHWGRCTLGRSRFNDQRRDLVRLRHCVHSNTPNGLPVAAASRLPGKCQLCHAPFRSAVGQIRPQLPQTAFRSENTAVVNHTARARLASDCGLVRTLSEGTSITDRERLLPVPQNPVTTSQSVIIMVSL